MRTLILALLLSTSTQAQVQLRYTNNQTLAYDEVIASYELLDSIYPNARLLEVGTTDSGKPLHLFVMGAGVGDGEPDLQKWKKSKVVVLVNNGIHPGESCGIDASLAFATERLQRGVSPDLMIAIIPVYNVGGALNRSAWSRANQQGPEEYGFRGNARNLDLNRDFIKADALNTRSFYALFHLLKPHLFVDTHTSNGADYQYTMSLISTQQDKLNPALVPLLTQDIQPYLYQSMKESGWEMTPYVNIFGTTPDKGFSAFLETPRYASGYTALFNTIGFITEAHMLKPYEDRVEATLSFLKHISNYAEKNSEAIQLAKRNAEEYDLKQNRFTVNWKLDSSEVENMSFKGFSYSYEASSLGSYKRLLYDNQKPAIFDVPYYGRYQPTDTVEVPDYYLVPQAWHQVPLLLQYNQVQMKRLPADTSIEVTSYYISEMEFSNRPYEGHFPIYHLKLEKRTQVRKFLKGDYLVPMNQSGRRFISSVLEPMAADSYLRWNFYDEIFSQKEYFSSYVFEDTAEEILKSNPELQEHFRKWAKENPEKLKSPRATLNFLYHRSSYYESEHRRYPVARIEGR